MRKYLKILLNNLKENRIYNILLVLMISVSLFLTVFFLSVFNSYSYDYYFLEGAELDRLYYVMNKSSAFSDGDFSTQTSPIVTENEAVEKIYQLTHIGIDRDTRIIMADEALFLEFPTFKKASVDASLMQSYNDVIGLSPLSRDSAPDGFNVVGYSNAPYKFFSFGARSNSDFPFSNIFKSYSTGAVYVAKDSKELRDAYKDRMISDAHYVIKFKESATDEQKDALFKELEVYGCTQRSFLNISQATKSAVISQIKENLPMPLFLLAVSSIAYLSALVLVFKKKEKDFSIFYVCGCSKGRMIILTIASCLFMILPALIINLLIFSLWYPISSLIRFQSVSLYINGYSYLVMLLYSLLTVIIAVTTTLVNMKKYSPIEFLKGVSE